MNKQSWKKTWKYIYIILVIITMVMFLRERTVEWLAITTVIVALPIIDKYSDNIKTNEEEE